MNQASPKDIDSVLAARYWLTPAGYAVLQQIQDQEEEPCST